MAPLGVSELPCQTSPMERRPDVDHYRKSPTDLPQDPTDLTQCSMCVATTGQLPSLPFYLKPRPARQDHRQTCDYHSLLQTTMTCLLSLLALCVITTAALKDWNFMNSNAPTSQDLMNPDSVDPLGTLKTTEIYGLTNRSTITLSLIHI